MKTTRRSRSQAHQLSARRDARRLPHVYSGFHRLLHHHHETHDTRKKAGTATQLIALTSEERMDGPRDA